MIRSPYDSEESSWLRGTLLVLDPEAHRSNDVGFFCRLGPLKPIESLALGNSTILTTFEE